MLAEFKCLKCGYEYKDKPGPTICPKCSHLYVKWVNYEDGLSRRVNVIHR
jgi:rubrerythrin